MPKPSPLLAPRTRPAISTKRILAGIVFCEAAISASLSKRVSGTLTSPVLGSMVQKGKFSACADAVCVKALNNVDFPIFGRP